MPLMSHASLFVILAGMVSAAGTVSPLVTTIRDFSLQDFRGKEHHLHDYRDRAFVVVAFVGTECPLAKLYGPRLQELHGTYASKGVAFLAINSNQHDTLEEIAHYAKVHGLEFPLLKDPSNKVADLFGAKRTPEVFVLDPLGEVRYRGRIDDQYGIGTARSQPKRRDLSMALDQLLAGKAVEIPTTEAAGCIINRVRREPGHGTITYSKQIARITRDHCVECHRPGQIAPFALTDYDNVAAWAQTIHEVLSDQRMPPWHADPQHGSFANDRSLSAEEKRQFLQWIENGVPEGDAKEMPEPKEYSEGWRIPQPDVVFKMPEAYRVKAEGTVPYRYFFVDPNFTEDKWVVAAEARPGNRAVVHHIIVFYVEPGKSVPENALMHSIATMSPGLPPLILPPGMAKRIPAGSRLAFQMHYTPNGTEQLDQSDVGLVLCDRNEVQKTVQSIASLNFRFRIPPGAADYPVRTEHKFWQDYLLLSLTPHMHYRGKSFQFRALYPDSRSEILLNVPQYDFNWQTSYWLSEPKLIPEGTTLQCDARFDNSADNLANPDPTVPVGWGEQTWEEMMVGFFNCVLVEQDLTLPPPEVIEKKGDQHTVRFRYKPTQKAEKLYLAGAFNEWKPDGHAMQGPDKEGSFETTVTLPAGEHEYKFVIDGNIWKYDPANPKQTGFYNNSLLSIP